MTPERAAVIQAQVQRGAPTFTGKFVDPMDLQESDIDVRDIAHHLSHANRYMGACDAPFSVAQHSVLCARIAFQPFKRATLFHDAAEAYFGDLSRVLKYNRSFAGMLFRQEEAKATAVIERALGFDPGELSSDEVKWADDLMGDLEWDILIKRNGSDLIVPWSAQYAEAQFLDAAERYC